MVDFLAVDFLADFATVFLAGAFFAAVFLEATFLVDFFAVDFFAAAFFVATELPRIGWFLLLVLLLPAAFRGAAFPPRRARDDFAADLKFVVEPARFSAVFSAGLFFAGLFFAGAFLAAFFATLFLPAAFFVAPGEAVFLAGTAVFLAELFTAVFFAAVFLTGSDFIGGVDFAAVFPVYFVPGAFFTEAAVSCSSLRARSEVPWLVSASLRVGCAERC